MDSKKIFLASSSELKDDRQAFEIFISRKNNDWVKRGVHLELVIWEDFLDALSRTRLQDEYNRAIRDCDLFVMLFCTKVGQYTAEEFETAFGQFHATGKPFIFTYFKDAQISTGSANRDDLQSLWAFQDKLKALGHFQTPYQNPEGLLLHFGQQLDKLAAQGFIEFDQGQAASTVPNYQTTLNGNGAIAQGQGAMAVGAGGVLIGGNNSGNINTGIQTTIHAAGTYVRGNLNVAGDLVGRNKITDGETTSNLESLCVPLLAAVASQAAPAEKAEAIRQVQELKVELAKGNKADDNRLETILDGLSKMVPGVVEAVVSSFAKQTIVHPTGGACIACGDSIGREFINKARDGHGKEQSVIAPLPPIKPTDSGVLYPVWFGTNCKPAGNGFTCERNNRLTFGRVGVLVPKAHRFGETGSSFWVRLGRFDLRDDRLRLQVVERQERDTFFEEIQSVMQEIRGSGNGPHALIYLHGFNVTFEDAAIRAAQIGYDLNVQGATAFFCWPSRGTVSGYPADEATIEASEKSITDFLVDFTGNCGAEKVHVIAHSMGNRGLLRALQRIAAKVETHGKIKFGQIFLAAPDVDRDLFLGLAHLYHDYSERTTLYSSDGDKAVFLSAKLHEAPRAGYFPPYTVATGLDTVIVPNFNIDLLGHGYFAKAEALLHDIYDLMRHGAPPESRQRLAPDEHDGLHFWRLIR